MNVISRIAEPVVNVNDISRISDGTVVTGEIKSSGDIRVDGAVEGKLISSGKIVIGESAKINGTIICSNLDLWGTVEGDIFIKDVLSLKQSSVVTGSVHVRKFQVELGAQLNGTCQMISEDDFDKFNGTVPEED